MKYPFLNLETVNRPYFGELRAALDRVLLSGRYIGGEELSTFENTLAGIVGTEHAVGVSNGLDALRLIFRALIELGRLKRGDGVIVPANTYIASVLAISDAGLVPVFVDVCPDTMNIDSSMLEEVYDTGVKALLTVHLYGRPACDDKMKDFVDRHQLILVEDNAQALGATAFDGRPTGSLGHAAAFSFYPTKNIGALGDAGAVTTDDALLAQTVRTLANYGSDVRYHNIYKGFNCRLDPLQAVVLNVKLRYLDTETARRRALAAVYDAEIVNEHVRKPLMQTPDNCVWHQYCLLSDTRDDLRSFLADKGVGTDINYPCAVHKQPCYSEFASVSMPVSEKIAREVLCLPVSACTSVADASAISKIINSYEP